MGVRETMKAFFRPHLRGTVLLGLLLAAGALDATYLDSWLQNRLVEGAQELASGVAAEWETTRVGVALLALTVFLAFSNLYLKISLRAPHVQRRLRPHVFWNVPFLIYLVVYLLLTVLAYFFFTQDIEHWFIAVIAASLVGIGVANADIKFGGFSLLPLAEFLQGLEAVVEAAISTEVNELDIAKRARLRDRLAARIPESTLERECRLLDMTDKDLTELKTLAGNNAEVYRGLLAREVVKKSEANAQRLLEQA